MKFMLDTNICSFLMQGLPQVLTAFSDRKKDGIAISAITLAELEFGVCNCGKEKADRYKSRLISFLTMVDVLEWGSLAAVEYGRIFADLRKRGEQIGIFDTLIAAHAKSIGLVVVTNNIREFKRVDGLVIEDWTV
jgi:tRNA(fMet)-specific endonuclease VapC